MSTQHVTTIHTGRRRLQFQMHHRLALAMDEAGVSADEMAALLKRSTGTISNYRTKATTPPHAAIVLWADRCDVDVDWVLYGDSAPDPDTASDLPVGGHGYNDSDATVIALRPAA